MQRYILAIDSLNNSFSIIESGNEIKFKLYYSNIGDFDELISDDILLGYDRGLRVIKYIFKVTGVDLENKSLGLEKLIEVSEGAIVEDFNLIEKLATQDVTKISNKEFIYYYYNILNYLFLFDDEEDSSPYNQGNFFKDVYMNLTDYEIILKLLKNKKNIILQGPPGVGKTFLSKRLAYSLIGSESDDRVKMVQFHQSYSYEDFIMGYRPNENNFKLETGLFYDLCQKAIIHPNNNYFIIIDEINRGNLSKIFGELFMLIENDKRGEKIHLLYSDEEFYIPENLYIIGLMNTADRSLAMFDYALRRRFAFFDLKPGFSSDGFEIYKKELGNSTFDNLISVMNDLNEAIEKDENLGEGFRIGHSYFCNLDEEDDVVEKLNYIIRFEIIPLLKEYWFDEPKKVNKWCDEFKRVFESIGD